MSKISLSSLGKIEISKISPPSDLVELRKKILEIPQFANNEQDELILFYIKESKNSYIESDYRTFLKLELNQININIKEKSSSSKTEEKLNTPTEKKNE